MTPESLAEAEEAATAHGIELAAQRLDRFVKALRGMSGLNARYARETAEYLADELRRMNKGDA